ncbi:MAG: arginine--tRNA ligase, partial [Minisyncoccia bacterium]
MNINQKIKKTLSEILAEINVENTGDIHLEHPNDLSHGDFSTNLAMTLSKQLGKNPREIADEISEKLSEKNLPEIESVSVAGPGFINIALSPFFFENSLKHILDTGMEFGNLDIAKDKKILVEHSSPNLFKPFHIGHMMNNTVGETMARLCYVSGAQTTVISYPSDVSLGIGKAVWQLMHYGVEKLDEYQTIGEKMKFLGKCYADGTNAMAENPDIEPEIRTITQDIYEHRDTPAYEAYKIGRDLNLQYFIQMTARLGSVFDGYIFESEAGIEGKKLILENTPDIYTKGEQDVLATEGGDTLITESGDAILGNDYTGTIIYQPSEDEEKTGLHTRVFINRDGNPTYEAKDTGLLKLKFEKYNPDLSIFVTDSEQGPYFKVVGTAAGKINPDWQEKTKHMTHGRMQFKGEKMSSRLGNTPIVSDILDSVNEAVYEKSGDRPMTDERADMISIAALKYSILRTQPGKNINFDP